jgi:hypothetical protein
VRAPTIVLASLLFLVVFSAPAEASTGTDQDSAWGVTQTIWVNYASTTCQGGYYDGYHAYKITSVDFHFTRSRTDRSVPNATLRFGYNGQNCSDQNHHNSANYVVYPTFQNNSSQYFHFDFSSSYYVVAPCLGCGFGSEIEGANIKSLIRNKSTGQNLGYLCSGFYTVGGTPIPSTNCI